MDQPVFYYDLSSPECYLAAERALRVLPVVPEWEPVLGVDLPGYERQVDDNFRTEIERRAADLGLQELRWPQAWPFDSREAMLAATYAKQIGRCVAFSLAGFRQAFAGGHDLGSRDVILIAAAACEMHPNAVLKALERRGVAVALADATTAAATAGVGKLPALRVGTQIFSGESALELAATEL